MTAIGVAGVVIGFLAVLLNVIVGYFWIHAYLQSAPPQVLLAVPLPVVPPYTGDVVGPRGISKGERLATVATLNNRPDIGSAISKDEAAMLDRLLADAGADVFNAAGGKPLDAGIIAAGSRTAAGHEASDNEMPHHFFNTAAGEVEFDNRSASFKRVATGQVYRADGNAFIDAAGKRHWSSVVLSELLEEVRSDAWGRMNAIQASALLNEARSIPVDPAAAQNGNFPRPHVYQAPSFGGFIGNKDELTVSVAGKFLRIYPNGRVADASQFPNGIDPVTGLPPIPTLRPLLPGSRTAMLAQAVECGWSMMLAIILIVASFRGLLNYHGAISLLLWYAWIKICTVIVAGAAGLWFIQSVAAGVGAPARLKYNTQVGMRGVVTALVFQSIYSIVVLMIVRTESIKDHFARQGETVSLLTPATRRRLTFKASLFLGTPRGAIVLWACVFFGIVVATGEGYFAFRSWNDPSAFIPPVFSVLGAIAAIIIAALLATFALRLPVLAGNLHVNEPKGIENVQGI